MTHMTDDSERGDLDLTRGDGGDGEARLRAASENDRQRAHQLRRDARTAYRAMEGWRGEQSEEDWLRICHESAEEYQSGRFLLERLGAERHLDPKLMATLWCLRQQIISEWGITTAAETMLLDLAILDYYNALKAQAWIGNLSLHLEHQFFGQDAFGSSDQERLRPGARRAVEDRVRRIVEQIMPLADRANRMFIRNLKAIKELRQASRTVTHFRVSSEEFTSVTSTCSKNGDIGDFGSRGR
jgi:hypothetical protein